MSDTSNGTTARPRTRIRGIATTSEVKKEVTKTMTFYAADLIRLLRLPADAKLTFAASPNEFSSPGGHVSASWTEVK
jgi:hypothetical protein